MLTVEDLEKAAKWRAGETPILDEIERTEYVTLFSSAPALALACLSMRSLLQDVSFRAGGASAPDPELVEACAEQIFEAEQALAAAGVEVEL